MVLLSAIIVAASIIGAALLVARELGTARAQAASLRSLDIVSLFAPGVAAAVADPRALLAWQPLAKTARRLAPEIFAELDRAAGATFPFSPEQIQAAHARWTTDWLAWERAHDAEFKMKAAAAASDLSASGGSALAHAKADLVEREKLELYQRRYAEYVQTAKALQALLG